MSYNDYKDKICLLGLGVLDKSVGYLVKFEFQGNNQGNIKEILTLNNCLLFIWSLNLTGFPIILFYKSGNSNLV